MDFCTELGKVLREQGKLAEATDYFRESIEIQPDWMHAHVELGKTLVELGQVDEALAVYRRAIEAAQGYPFAVHYHLGLALREAGREEEARRKLDEVERFGYKPRE